MAFLWPELTYNASKCLRMGHVSYLESVVQSECRSARWLTVGPNSG